MAKQCLYCGLLLPEEEAHFCNQCGQFQLPPPGSAVTVRQAPIRVKLPPKEFSRFETFSPWPEPGVPEIVEERPSFFSSEHPTMSLKRNVPLKPQEPPSWLQDLEEAQELEEQAFLPGEYAASSNSTQPEAGPEPGFRASLSLVWSSTGKWETKAVKLAEQQASEQKEVPSTPLVPPPSPEQAARPFESTRLYIKLWEREETQNLAAPLPQPQDISSPLTSDQLSLASLPSFADAQPSLAPLPLAAQEDPLAEAEREPTQLQPSIDPFQAIRAMQPREESLWEEHPEQANSERYAVEDVPTNPLNLSDLVGLQPNIIVERTSTPAPKNWPPVPVEELSELPTRPLLSYMLSSPLSMPSSAQMMFQARSFDPLNSYTQPKIAASSPAPARPKKAGRSSGSLVHSQVSAGQDLPVQPEPENSYSAAFTLQSALNSSDLATHVDARTDQQRQSAYGADSLEARSSAFMPRLLPASPFPLPTDSAVELVKQRGKKKRYIALAVFIFLVLLLAGGFLVFGTISQPFTVASVSQPVLVYQHTTFVLSRSWKSMILVALYTSF